MAQLVEKVNPYDGGGSKTEQVRQMFDSIAPAYDFMNKAMSFGLHRLWLRRAIRAVKAGGPLAILDVATGTADVAIALAGAMPRASVTGIDLSRKMVDIGRRKVAQAGLSDRVGLVVADCLDLPFEDEAFDAVTVAYGVRNFERLLDGYREMFRVLRPGGSLTVIELSTPANRFVRPFYNLYTRHVIPLIGRLVSHDLRAYSYLPESIAAVAQRSAMAGLMEQAGFVGTSYHTMTFGVCTLYCGRRPLPPERE